MERTIKFKAKEIEYGYTVIGSLVTYNPIPSIRSTEFNENDYDYPEWEVDEKTICQFLMTDINNKDVYEHDLINISGRINSNPHSLFYSKNGVLKCKNKFGEFNISDLELYPYNIELIDSQI